MIVYVHCQKRQEVNSILYKRSMEGIGQHSPEGITGLNPNRGQRVCTNTHTHTIWTPDLRVCNLKKKQIVFISSFCCILFRDEEDKW